jgi:hypothetical protein
VAAFRGLRRQPELVRTGRQTCLIGGRAWPPLAAAAQLESAIENADAVPLPERGGPVYQAQPLRPPFPADDRPYPVPPGPRPPRAPAPPPPAMGPPCPEVFLFYGLCFQYEDPSPLNTGEPLWGETQAVGRAFAARGYRVKDGRASGPAPDGSKAKTFEDMMAGLDADLNTTTFCQCPGDQLVIYLAGHSEYPGDTPPFRTQQIRYVTDKDTVDLVTYQRLLDRLAKIGKIANAPKKLYLIVESCRSGRLHEGGVFPPELAGMHVLTSTSDTLTKSCVNGFSVNVTEALGRYGAVDWTHFVDLVKWGHAKAGQPAQYPHQPKNADAGPCRVKVTLEVVNYGGADIGDDWMYDIEVDGLATNVAEHNLANTASENPRRVLYDRLWGACGTQVRLPTRIKATEVDPVTDDAGSTDLVIQAVCQAGQAAVQASVKVHEDSNTAEPAALLAFVLQVQTWCT